MYHYSRYTKFKHNGKKPASISQELTRVFMRNLFEQKDKFQKKTGKKWNCVTLDGFRFAVTNMDEHLQGMIDMHWNGTGCEKEQLETMKANLISSITSWFDDNYESIIYSLEGKLPWA